LFIILQVIEYGSSNTLYRSLLTTRKMIYYSESDHKTSEILCGFQTNRGEILCLVMAELDSKGLRIWIRQNDTGQTGSGSITLVVAVSAEAMHKLYISQVARN
jgi:hypothetical protein